jgi:RNA polymerase sigma-70 factor (ECF subfamily)
MTVTSNKVNYGTKQAVADKPDFESAFLEHWPRIFNVIFRLLGDRDEAEDLALETFWRLYQKPPRSSENLAGWLYRVAVNLGFNALRAQRRRTRYEEDAGMLNLETNSSVYPEDEVDRGEQRREVRGILAKMKPRSAKILTLRYSGLSYAEVAAAIKVKPSSVGKLLARAEDEFEKIYRRSQGE